MNRTAAALLVALPLAAARAQEPSSAAAPPVLARFGEGAGPAIDGTTIRLLDAARTKSQSNAIAFEPVAPGARESLKITCKLRVLEGGDGGAFALLSTAEHGARGPAPFVRDWTEPNLRGSFAVGIDVHDPKNEDPFGPFGNYEGRPEREVSLHWDGREIVKRVAPAEFRGDFADAEIAVEHVCGGADVSVKIAGASVYDRYFVADFLPYEARLAIGAGTRADAATEFDVKDLRVEAGPAAKPRRAPQRVEVFHHVLTDNKRTAFETEVTLPPIAWEFGRVILDLEIHDAGEAWDEWDRCGELSVFDEKGVKHGIVPFITSYRTPCRWKVDVTALRPWLAGRTRFEIAAGTTFYKNRGYMMSASLEFHHGAGDLEAFRVVPLWNGTAQYRSAENHFADFFAPREVPIDEDTAAARLFVTTTGHSQVGEFTPSKRTVVVTPAPDATAARFASTLWKDDNYLNPSRPQFGTWKYARAGWAPGDVVRPWWIDVSGIVVPGKTATFAYEPQAYDFAGLGETPPEKDVAEASHNVRSYLVLWRKAGTRVPAPTLQVRSLVAGGNAAKAGVAEGDWLVSYDGRPLAALDDLRVAIQAADAASKARRTVVLYRGAERIEAEVGPGKLGVGLSDR